MGWFGGLFGSSKPEDDPLARIKPRTREFLKKESPIKIPDRASPPPPTGTSSPTSTSTQQQQAQAQAETTKPVVPQKSLYQDGRYADLWKTYRPLGDIEAETKTSHEQLMDVLEGFKERKNIIGRAALENCALQQEEWRKCMTSGDWSDKMQMCRHQVRKFERCYNMQSRFLRVLGYRSVQGRNPIVDEDIQMHADALYQRMMAHEAAVELAKKEGRPVPEFQVVPTNVLAPDPGPAVRKIWEDKLAKLPEDERAVEEAALRRDFVEKQETAEAVKGIWTHQDEERRQRAEQGKASPLDHFWNWMRK